jgi:hypothetical protein
MKSLVIAVHPHLEESRIHRAWLATLLRGDSTPCRWHLLPPFVLNGVAHVSEDELAASGAAYLRYLALPRGGKSPPVQWSAHKAAPSLEGALS